MINIFDKTYDSESISDAFRDISEVLDERFNDKMKSVEVTEDSIFQVKFEYILEDKKVILMSNQYSQESFIDVEDDIHETLSTYPFEEHDFGFFDGDLIIKIDIL